MLTALDREMKVQAGRFRDTQRIELFVLGDSGPKADLKVSMVHREGKSLHFARTQVRSQYRVIQNVGMPAPDRTGQFLYRSFDLQGKPLSPFGSKLPFTIPLPGQEPVTRPIPDKITLAIDNSDDHPSDYRPWDMDGFTAAAHGKEPYANIVYGVAPMRLLSVPLKHGDTIAGVVQIAAPLGQLNRDIAGLTRTLLLVLPLSLLVAVVAGIFLTDRALRPVKEMTHAASEIRADQLSRRLPVSGADEFDELASTFNRALERVETAFIDRERAIAQLRRFTADASHELRTPLTTIKANTGVALTDSEPSAEHVHSLRQIDRAADRMTALVQDLLLLARSDAGQLSLDLEAVSLPEVVREAIDCLPQSPHAPIKVAAAGPEPLVCGDFDHLRRLFLNLLQNSVLHTPHDGGITVAIEERGNRARVTVSDTGCGILPEHLPHLGQPFYRADAGRNRKQGGAGFGAGDMPLHRRGPPCRHQNRE